MVDQRDDGEGQGSNLTIVGGRPRSRRTGSDTPDGVQQVLVLAASDEEFRERLLGDREAALEQCGIALSKTERAVIMAAPPDQLEAMVTRLVPADPQRREFLRQAARTGGAIAAAALLAGTGCADDNEDVRTKGIRPDPPDHSMKPTGIRPDPVPPPKPPQEPASTGGIRPDPVPPSSPSPTYGVTRGIRPDRPVPEAPPEETPPEPDDQGKAKGGIRPDRPPRILGIRPGGKTRGIRPDRPTKKSTD